MFNIRSILANPEIYDFFQNVMGARKSRSEFAERSIRAREGDRILDMGCGTADILAHLPKVEYVGFDINDRYIAAAQTRYGDRGHFYCRELTPDFAKTLPQFDLVLAIGLLHHLDDDTATAYLRMARAVLRPQGRLISIDPVIEKDQNPVARFLIKRDRGGNVRTGIEYRQLAESVFREVHGELRHKVWIPYTHWIMECSI